MNENLYGKFRTITKVFSAHKGKIKTANDTSRCLWMRVKKKLLHIFHIKINKRKISNRKTISEKKCFVLWQQQYLCCKLYIRCVCMYILFECEPEVKYFPPQVFPFFFSVCTFFTQYCACVYIVRKIRHNIKVKYTECSIETIQVHYCSSAEVKRWSIFHFFIYFGFFFHFVLQVLKVIYTISVVLSVLYCILYISFKIIMPFGDRLTKEAHKSFGAKKKLFFRLDIWNFPT